MISNKLSVNPNKMEYLLFNQITIPNCNINIDSKIILPNILAKNLGVTFQSEMSMEKHISALVKFCFLQLRNFHRICPFISITAAITLANAFVYSHFNYCNSLFYGLPKNCIHRLQKIQNTTAHIVLRTSASLILHLFLNLYTGYQ